MLTSFWYVTHWRKLAFLYVFTLFAAGCGGARKDLVCSVSERIDELRHHMRIESAIEDGASNAIKLLLTSAKSQDKSLAEVRLLSLALKEVAIDLCRHLCLCL